MNEELKILIAAILDKAKSENNINAQLKQLKLDTLRLNFDIDKGTSGIGKQLQESIRQTQATVDNNPINMKIIADQQSLKGLQNQLEILKSQFKDVDKYTKGELTTNNVGAVTGAKITYFDKDLQQQITQTYALDTAIGQLYNSQNKLIDNSAKQAEAFQKLISTTTIYKQKLEEFKNVYSSALAGSVDENPFKKKVESIDFSNIKDQGQLDSMVKKFDEAVAAGKNLNSLLNKQWGSIAFEGIDKRIGELSGKIGTLELNFSKLGNNAPKGTADSIQELKKSLSELENIKDPFKKTVAFNEIDNGIEKLTQDYKKFANTVNQTKLDVNLDLDKAKLTTRIETFLRNNQKAVKSLGGEFDLLKSKIANADKTELGTLTKQVQNLEGKARSLGVTGRTVFGELKNNISKFGSWFLIGGGVSSAVRSITSAITELKDIDTQLTEISKTSELTTQQLKELGNASFDAANKYGATVQGYLEGVKEFSRAGKENAQALAEVSILAQSAGDMTSETANKYLLATDAAYKLGGNEKKLTAVLDAQNQITNRNAVNMEQLAQATMVAGSQAAQSGVSVDKMTAAVSTMAIVTQQGGDIAGRAFKGILMNLQQVSGELDGEIIDETSFKKVEKTLDSVGVSMSTVVDGAVKMREPMEILKELSQVYNSLDDLDPRKAAIISDLGGKYRGNQLSGLLGNWEIYEKVLSDYTNSTGSALEEAQKTADSWEGRLNKLTNTWNGFVGNFASSDFFKGAITGGESLIKIFDGIISTLGGIPTLAATAAAALSFQNIGISNVKYAPPYPLGTAA